MHGSQSDDKNNNMASDQSLPCFILRAPSSPQARLASSTHQLAHLGIQAERITGVSPGDPLIDDVYSSWANRIWSKRDLTEAEIDAAIGHRRIWQTILDRGLPAAVIFEDDFRCVEADRVRRALSAAAMLAREWDIIKLFEFKHRPSLLRITSVEGVDFALYARPSSGLVGYVINAKACERLLSCKLVCVPIDEEVRFSFAYGLKVCSTFPNVVEDNGLELGGSMIEASRLMIKQKRSLIRSIWGNVLGLYMRTGSYLWALIIAWQLDRSTGMDPVWRRAT